MPWFKVDDNLAFHHKAIAAGNASMGLWARAGSFCAAQLTDGRVPDHMLPQLGTRQQAKRLCDVGLWYRVDNGYQFHEWHLYQPTKAEVEERRESDRKRKAERRSGSSRSPQDVRADTDRNPDGLRTDASRARPHPDPTRPVVPKGTTGGAPKRATQRPPEWSPNDKHEDIANEVGVDLAGELSQFCDHHDAKGSTFKDWDAAFRTWLRNAAKFRRDRATPAQPPPPTRFRDVTTEPPPLLSPQEYADWEAEQRRKAR